MSRLNPPDPATYDDRQRTVAQALSSGPRGGVRGPFKLLMHNPELAARLSETGEVVRWGLSLPPALLEVAILEVAAHFSAATIQGTHEVLAAKAGIAPDDIAAIRAREHIADGKQAAVLQFTRELLRTQTVSDASFSRTKAILGERGVVELIALIGYYHISCMIVAVAQLTEEEWRR